MRIAAGALCLFLMPVTGSISMAADTSAVAPAKAEHPQNVALSQDAKGNWQYKSFPELATLYIYLKDTPGESHCNIGCDSAWPPLLVSSSESHPRVGDWEVVVRRNGSRQWAYKGRPVYTRYHDMADSVSNIERDGFAILTP